jgi:DNA repair protein RadC
VLQGTIHFKLELRVSASVNTLPRTPTIVPFRRPENVADELSRQGAGGEFTPPYGPDQPLGDRAEIREAFALAALKREILEQAGKAISSDEALLLLSSLFFTAAEARQKSHDLLKEFGSLGAILSASRERIGELVHDRDDFWITLKSIQSLISNILKERISDKPILNNQSLYDYLRVSLAHEKNEVVKLLFLNSKNALILDELHSKGTVNHTPVYPREIVRRVIEVGANALIIVHNHPSGDPTPSEEDVHMTRLVGNVLNGIGVILHDHVIVGLHRCQSMRALRLI